LNNKDKRNAEVLCINYDDSFKKLYRASFDSLVLYLKTQFRSCPQQAEDIAQNAFEKIATRKNPGPIGNIKAFLWRTAHNIAISDIRSKRLATKYHAETKNLYGQEEEYPLTPERILEGKEQIGLAVQTLRQMPEQRRRAFILTRIEGLSHTKASEKLGISRPAVSKHVARATSDLYTALHNELRSSTKK